MGTSGSMRTRCFLVLLMTMMGLAPEGARAQSGIWAGLSLVDFDYEEKATGRDRSRERGLLPAMEGGGRFFVAPGHALVGHLQLTYNGTTRYTGTDFHTYEAISATDFHQILDVGARYEMATPWGMWIFAGLGYRSWDRFLSYGTGYREIYRWGTFSLGARGRITDLGEVQIGWEAMVRPVLWGTLDVLFSETFTDGIDSGLSLGSRTGYRLSAPFTVARDLIWGLTPLGALWYDWSEIGRSNTVFNGTPAINGLITEPASQTRQIGLFLALKKDF